VLARHGYRRSAETILREHASDFSSFVELNQEQVLSVRLADRGPRYAERNARDPN
jgi:hypothetical protein